MRDPKMKKIVDYKHQFTGKATTVGGTCRVRLYTDESQSQIVGLCTHLADNKFNISCSKRMANIMGDVREKHFPKAENEQITWVEHQPSDVGPDYGEHRFELVKLAQADQIEPEWVTLNETQLERQTGLTMRLIA